MADGMLGANPDELRALAETLDARSEELREARGLLDAAVDGCIWTGEDRDRDADEWSAFSQSVLARLAERLADDADGLDRQAEDQDGASGLGGTVDLPTVHAPEIDMPERDHDLPNAFAPEIDMPQRDHDLPTVHAPEIDMPQRDHNLPNVFAPEIDMPQRMPPMRPPEVDLPVFGDGLPDVFAPEINLPNQGRA